MQAHSDDPDYLQKNYHTGLTFSHQASLSAGSFAKNVYHCNWPVFKFVSCFFPNLFVFSRFSCVCHRLHPSQCKISEPSGRLQFKAPSPVFAISTSPLLSVEANKTTTRCPVVTTGTDPDKSGTNLYRLSNLQKIAGRIFTFFLDFYTF